MFEVGKSYKTISGVVTKCVFAGSEIVVLKFACGREAHTNQCCFTDFEEVVEPRREFFNAMRAGGTETWYHGPHATRERCDETSGNYHTRYGVLELIHHSESRVESIFHMVKK